MQDLKDEGNDLFKEGDFDNSWMHYRNALFIARILELRFYHIVDKEFKSTLFSNRAFCCLKKVWWHQTNENLHFFSFSPSMLSTISTLSTWGLFIYLFIFYFLQFQEMYIEAIKDCESGIKSLHSEKMLSD